MTIETSYNSARVVNIYFWDWGINCAEDEMQLASILRYDCVSLLLLPLFLRKAQLNEDLQIKYTNNIRVHCRASCKSS